MTGHQCPGGCLELHLELHPLAGRDRLRLCTDLAERIAGPHAALGKVEHAACDERAGAVGGDVAQLDGEVANWCGGAHLECDLTVAEHH